MEEHLMKKHGCNKEAKTLSECGVEMRLTDEVQEQSIMRKYRPKPWEVGGRAENGDDDDDDDDGEDEQQQRMTSAPPKRRRM
jgi:hypothetical protein